jgi:hypothetical protein
MPIRRSLVGFVLTALPILFLVAGASARSARIADPAPPFF